MSTKKTKLLIPVEPELREAFKKYAQEKGTTMSELTREWMRQVVSEVVIKQHCPLR